MHAMKAYKEMKVQFHLLLMSVPAAGDYICEAEYAKTRTLYWEISLNEKEHRAQLFIVLPRVAYLVRVPIQRSKKFYASLICVNHKDVGDPN
jgi:hypothetical protein